MATLQSLQIAIFLLTICHTVVIIPDDFPHNSSGSNQATADVDVESSFDPILWRLIRLAYIAKSRNIAQTEDVEHCADMILLASKQDLLQFWRSFFDDALPNVNASKSPSKPVSKHVQIRPRIDVITDQDEFKIFQFLAESFEGVGSVNASSEKPNSQEQQKKPENSRFRKQKSEREWFVFAKTLWNEFSDSKVCQDLKTVLRKSEINIY